MGNPTSQSNAQSLRDVLVGLGLSRFEQFFGKKFAENGLIEAFSAETYLNVHVPLPRKKRTK